MKKGHMTYHLIVYCNVSILIHFYFISCSRKVDSIFILITNLEFDLSSSNNNLNYLINS